MAIFSVGYRGAESVDVDAINWMVALGIGLSRLNGDIAIEGLACEVLQNGTVIARDTTNGRAYIVQEVDEIYPEPEVISLEESPEPVQMRISGIRDAATVQLACENALQLAHDFVPGESGAVILKKGDKLYFVATSGPKGDELKGRTLPVGSGIVGVAMEVRRPMVLGEAKVDPRHCRTVDALTGYETQGMACVPIVQGERIFGVLEILNLPGGERFGRVYVESLQAVADLLALRLSRSL